MNNRFLSILLIFMLIFFISKLHANHANEVNQIFRIGTLGPQTNLYRYIAELGANITKFNRQDKQFIVYSSQSYVSFHDALYALQKKQVESIVVPVSMLKNIMKSKNQQQHIHIISPFNPMSFAFLGRLVNDKNMVLDNNIMSEYTINLGFKNSVQFEISYFLLKELAIDIRTLQPQFMSSSDGLEHLKTRRLDITSIFDMNIEEYIIDSQLYDNHYVPIPNNILFRLNKKYDDLTMIGFKHNGIYQTTLAMPMVWITNVDTNHRAIAKIARYIEQNKIVEQTYTGYQWKNFYKPHGTLYDIKLHPLMKQE